jgi:ribose transport system ATP-binding protein
VSGSFVSDGRRLALRSAHDAIANGIVSVPQDRRREGCLLDLSLRENLTLGDLAPISRCSRISRRRERVEVAGLIEAFDIRPPDPERSLRLFSGGNQQKAVLARAVRLNPRMLVLDEPTQGIDIGAREEIGAIVRRLRAEDVAIVLASSDSEELFELADRVIVLHRGRIATTIARHELTRDRLSVALTAGRREAA